MKNPADLTHDQLAEIVTGMVRRLYGWQDESGTWTYICDKEWCGGDLLELAAELLDSYGLVPIAGDDGEPMDETTSSRE